MSLVISRDASAPLADDQVDVILKLVPIDVLSLYAAARPLVDASLGGAERALLVLGVLLTPALLYVVGRRAGRDPPLAQHAVRVLTFVAWAFAVGSPFGRDAPYARWIPGLALILIPVIGSYLFPPRNGVADPYTTSHEVTRRNYR